MKEQIHQLVLKALLAADGPMAESVLKAAIRRGIAPAVVTESDLVLRIQWCEQHGYIIGTNEGLVGTEWMLTTTGTLKARQLP